MELKEKKREAESGQKASRAESVKSRLMRADQTIRRRCLLSGLLPNSSQEFAAPRRRRFRLLSTTWASVLRASTFANPFHLFSTKNMAPTRGHTQNAEASSSKPKAKRNHQRNAPEPEASGAPGVQKIKAALRQTRRLLAKVDYFAAC